MNTLAGRYRLLAVVGRGGMGTVWRARDERLGRDVAVKILHTWVADDPRLRRRFDEEARTLAALQHPHVVRLYDVVQHEANPVLVLELVDGESVAALVAGGRRLPWDEASALCRPVAAALAYAHAHGVVHRDLSAANVLVEAASRRVVVSDFGLARLLSASGETPASTGVAGTPEYWSPEQAAGRTPGTATDVYALGCLLFRLLAGRMPFDGDDRLAAGLRRVREDAPPLTLHALDVPHEAGRLVDAMLARRPDDRPTAEVVARGLGAERSAVRVDVRRFVGRARPAAVTTVAPTRAADTAVLPRRSSRLHLAMKRGRVAAASLGVAAAVALAGGVYAGAGHRPPGIAAPALVGVTPAEARQRVAAAAQAADVAPPGVRVTGRAYSERVPAGSIVAQDERAGEHVPSTGTLGVVLSLGSAWAAVPDAAGRPARTAVADLAAAGFAVERRFGPSVSTPAWHVAQTDPPAGTRVRRPADVVVLVSTGPPRVAVPDVRGEERGDGFDRLERAGLAVRTEEAPSTAAEPGTILEVEPAQGTRVRMGSTVTLVVAREPRWSTLASFDGDGDYSTEPLIVGSGSRVVLLVENTSFLGFFGAGVEVSWHGGASGGADLGPGEHVLLEPAEARRTVAFDLDPYGSAYWTLVVEKLA